MQVVFELTEIQKEILLITRICSHQRILPDKVSQAFSALTVTKFQYFELLRRYTKNHLGVADEEEVQKNIARLVEFELLENYASQREETIRRPETNILMRIIYPFGREHKRIRETPYLRLTEEGVRIATAILEGRRADLHPAKKPRATVFIASATGYHELDQLFDMELKPACRVAGFSPFRADLSEPARTIPERMLQEIRNCKCLIADLTFARPSVYLEIGIACGLGIPLILTCREDHYRSTNDERRVHFDVEQFKISYWSLGDSGRFSWPIKMSPVERLKNLHADKSI